MTSTCTYKISPGESEAARETTRARRELSARCLRSVFLGARLEEIRDHLEELCAEAATSGWDGYGAIPVRPESLTRAWQFLLCLPISFPLPELGADGEGDVTLDWHLGWRRAFTAAVAPDGRISYAWVNGYSSSRGTEWFSDDIPPAIQDALAMLVKAGLPFER